MENTDLLSPTAPSLVFARETDTPNCHDTLVGRRRRGRQRKSMTLEMDGPFHAGD